MKKFYVLILVSILITTSLRAQEKEYKGRYVYAIPNTNPVQLEFVSPDNSQFCKLPIWSHPTLTARYNLDNLNALDEVEDAINSWNNVGANLSLINMGEEQLGGISDEYSLLYQQNAEPGNFVDQHNLIAS